MRSAWRKIGRPGLYTFLAGWVLSAQVWAEVPAPTQESRQAAEVAVPEDAPVALTLEEAVQRALGFGFTTQIAGLETDQAREAVLETLGAYLPQLMVVSQAGWSNRINEKMVAGDGRVYGLDNLGNDPWIDVFVQQALLDLPLWRRIKREQLGTKLAELAEWEVREAVAYEVLRLYAGLARQEGLKEAAVEHWQRMRVLEERSGDLLGAGRVLVSEHEAVGAALEQAALAIETIDLEVEILRADLRVALGDAEATGPVPQTVMESLPETAPVDFPEGVEAATLKTPAVQILDLRRQIGDASVSEAEAERWPTLVVRGGYANYGIKRFDEFEDAGYIFMGMEVPLFDGLQNHHAIGGAQKASDIARLRYRSGVAMMRKTLVGLNRELGVLGRRVALAERQSRTALGQLEVADLNLEARRGSLDESLLARERRSLRAIAAIEMRFGKLEVWARLHRELGQLANVLGGDAASRP